MKIAHLADLHIGKKLEEIDRNPEIIAALMEASQIIAEKNVKGVILAGDIFEHARPSVDSMDIFYQFLKNLKENKVEKIWIIAGNHDDDALLEVAKEFLEFSGIHIWGKITSNMESYFQKTTIDQEEIFIAALPYVNDIKILSEIDKKKVEEMSQAQRYVAAYRILLDYFNQQASLQPKNIKKILIAHLFLEGSILSHTERESSLEQYLCVPKDVFEVNNPFHYIALGHIHKFQESLLKFHHVYYSGSIIRLNFGEKDDPKGFRVYDTESNTVEFVELKTPKVLEEINVDVNQMADLEELKVKIDQQKIYKLKIQFAGGLMPLEIREKVREILGNNIKIEFLPKKKQKNSNSEMRNIEKAEDLIHYYKTYKNKELSPQITELLTQMACQVIEKESERNG